MRLSGYEIFVEPWGFATDSNNFVLGAAPDDKVVMNEECGLSEVKWWIQKHWSTRYLLYLKKTFTSCKILINKSHTYYDQI